MGTEVIIWNEREPLGGRTPAEFEAELARLLRGRVHACYVFGSYGRPEFSPDSDVDILLVADTQEPFVERPLAFSELLDLAPDMDLLVYTPAEFERLTKEPTIGFWQSVVASMRRLV